MGCSATSASVSISVTNCVNRFSDSSTELPDGIALSLSPNPFKDLLEVNFNRTPADQVSYVAMDVSGRIVYSGSIMPSSPTSIVTDAWAPGLYILHFKGPLGGNSFKVVKTE
jgi:hypothetical protein